MINGIDNTSSMSMMMMQQTQGQRPPKPPEFSEIDTDSSGGIDKAELAESLGKAPFAEQLQDEDIDEIFAMLDTDSDGILSESENAEEPSKIGEFMMTKYGMTRPEMPTTSQANSENAVVSQAINSYLQNSELSSSLNSTLVDIFE